jgi:O-antigen/teichoic acid export membrane protein
LTFITKGSQRSVKAKKNIIASFGIKGVSILIGLIKVPVILLYLDVEKYGVWLTIASIVDWVQYFDLGIGHGLRNKFAEALANNNKERAKKLVSTAYFYITLIFIGLTLLLLPLVYTLNWQNILNFTYCQYHYVGLGFNLK